MTFLFSKPKTKDSPYSLFVLIRINDFFSPGNRIKRIEFAYLLHICFVHLQPPLIFIFVVSIYWFTYASHFIDVKRIHEFEANDLIYSIRTFLNIKFCSPRKQQKITKSHILIPNLTWYLSRKSVFFKVWQVTTTTNYMLRKSCIEHTQWYITQSLS